FFHSNRCVQRSATISFTYRLEVVKVLGNRRIPVGDDRIYAPAILFGMWVFKDDPDRKEVVYLFERLLLTLHLSKDRINVLGTAFNFKGEALLLEFLLDRLHKALNKLFARLSLLPQFTRDEFIRVGINNLETNEI